MTARGALALALLLVCGACAGRKGATPADLTPSGAPAGGSAPTQPAKPAPAPPPITGNGTQDAPVAAIPAVPGVPAGTPRAKAGEAPPATASVYVFSPEQAVSRPERPSTAAAPQAAVPPTPSGSEPGETRPPDETPEPAATPGELQLQVVASATQVASGEIVTADVIASSSTPVLDAPIHLTFDPGVIEYLDGAPGDFLTQGGSSVVFLADGRSLPGDVAIALGRVGRDRGASGTGLLCRVRFRAAGAGTSAVAVGQAKAWDVSGEPLRVRSAGTAVAVR